MECKVEYGIEFKIEYNPHAEPVACKGQEKDEFAKMPLLFVS